MFGFFKKAAKLVTQGEDIPPGINELRSVALVCVDGVLTHRISGLLTSCISGLMGGDCVYNVLYNSIDCSYDAGVANFIKIVTQNYECITVIGNCYDGEKEDVESLLGSKADLRVMGKNILGAIEQLGEDGVDTVILVGQSSEGVRTAYRAALKQGMRVVFLDGKCAAPYANNEEIVRNGGDNPSDRRVCLFPFKQALRLFCQAEQNKNNDTRNIAREYISPQAELNRAIARLVESGVSFDETELRILMDAHKRTPQPEGRESVGAAAPRARGVAKITR